MSNEPKTNQDEAPWFSIKNGWLLTRENQRFQLAYVIRYGIENGAVQLGYGHNFYSIYPPMIDGPDYQSGAKKLVAALDAYFAEHHEPNRITI